MNTLAAPLRDSSIPLMTKGYAWLPDRMRSSGGSPVQTRILGRPATAVHGREAVRFFYDDQHVRRRSALPGPVLDTLFGRGAVHTLDGHQHLARKALFMSLLKNQGAVARLTELVGAEWDAAAREWAMRPAVELFTESSRVLTRAVCDWAGIPLGAAETAELADDLVAMVDGFAAIGPRHLKARAARARREVWLEALIRTARADAGTDPGTDRGTEYPAGSPLRAVALHRDDSGRLLDSHTAAVEVLNIIRPTVAVAWFVTFAAHALERWPGGRDALRRGDPAYAEAFAHEVRRFYPFVPFVGGLAAGELRWQGVVIPEGSLVLLDVYGHQHDPDLWPHPYTFRPERFLGRSVASDELIPQGGGDAATGHRCPGEDITVALLACLSTRLADINYLVPPQDLSISLRRVPTRPSSGFVMSLRVPSDA